MNLYYLQTFVTPGFLLVIMIIFVGIILFFTYMFKREKEFEEKQGYVLKDYDKIIEEAHTKAKAVIDQASNEAATLLAQAQSTKLNVDMQADNAFKKIADEQIQLLHTNSEEYFHDYQSSLEEVKKHYTTQLGDMLAEIRRSTEKEFQELKAILKEQVTQSQGSVTKQMQDDFAQTQIEITEYKKRQLQKIDQSMNDLLLKVSSEILGKSIPLRDHQQLIVDSLEAAKKEGMFNI